MHHDPRGGPGGRGPRPGAAAEGDAGPVWCRWCEGLDRRQPARLQVLAFQSGPWSVGLSCTPFTLLVYAMKVGFW
jgi:hypothetical protein